MKEVFLSVWISVLVARLNKLDFYVFNVCRISCLNILINNYDSGLRGKRSGVRFLCNEQKNGPKIHSTHAYMLMFMSRSSSLRHKLLMLMLVLMLVSLMRTRL